jgi:hypothetical protein
MFNYEGVIFMHIIFMLNAEIDRDDTFDLIYVFVLFINLQFLQTTQDAVYEKWVFNIYMVIS